MTLQEMLNDVKADGREEGIAIGEERGAQQKALETARNALQMGFSFEQISLLTGLSIESVQEIADELNTDK